MSTQNLTHTEPKPESCTLCLSRCPTCHFGDLIKITYGYLTAETEWEHIKGTLYWGGCMPAGSNMHRCNLCGSRAGDYSTTWRMRHHQ